MSRSNKEVNRDIAALEEVAIRKFTRLAECPVAYAYPPGTVVTIAPLDGSYSIVRTVNGAVSSASWFSQGSSTLLANRPNAATFGVGSWFIPGLGFSHSDGANWTGVISSDGYFGPIDTRMFGAVWDGVTDDSAALSAAFNYSSGVSFKLPANKTAYIASQITLTKRIKLTSDAPRVYSAPKLRGAAGIDILHVNVAGCEFESIEFKGDGGSHGAGSTTNGIVALGDLSADTVNYNLDLKIDKCVFIYLNNAVEMKGRNLDIRDSSFSNVLAGIYANRAATQTDFRGLTIVGGNRFHSIGGQSTAAVAISIPAANNLYDCQINDNYFDDCYELINGFAGPLQISGNMASRNWGGGIHLNSTGWTYTDERMRLIINGNELYFFDSANISDGISVFVAKTATVSKITGSIVGNDVFGTSGNCLSIGSDINVISNLEVSNNTLSEPGYSGAYDCFHVGAEVGGLDIGQNNLNKGASTSTGYGYNRAGYRTLTTADSMNIVRPQRITGFATANKFFNYAISGPLDRLLGGQSPIANELPDSTNSGDANFSMRLGQTPSTVTLTGTITADRTIPLYGDNAIAGGQFRINRTGGGAFNWIIQDNASATIATLAVNEGVLCEISGTPIRWRVIEKYTL